MSARLDGDKRLNKKLKRHVSKMEQKTDAALKSGGLLIENEAKQNVPVRTGNLKRSLDTEVEGNKKEKEVIIGTEVDYADEVEYGTSTQRPQPYLRPAFDSKKKAAEQEISDALDKLVKEWQ